MRIWSVKGATQQFSYLAFKPTKNIEKLSSKREQVKRRTPCSDFLAGQNNSINYIKYGFLFRLDL